MSNSGSGSGSLPECTGALATNTLHITGYHFKSVVTPCLTHGENVDIVHGYRISNKKPVMAKVSNNSLELEREFYGMKRLYNLPDGPTYIVRPIECINLTSGLSVAIYANDGYTSWLHQQQRRASEELVPDSSNNSCNSSSEPDIAANNNNNSIRARATMMLRHSAGDVPTLVTPCPEQHLVTMHCDLGSFLRFAIKCTDCLEFIHRNDTVRGEIRLSAFQWIDGQQETAVKMWNFGSGKSFETYLTSEGWKRAANNRHMTYVLQNLLMYMSPEQTGRTTYLPDHRSDIYSLGIVFFTILTQQSPFDGGPLEVLNSIVSRKVPLVNESRLDIPEVLSHIIEKMTSKAPDDRYSSAHGVRADLKECLKRLLSNDDPNSTEMIPSFSLGKQDIASVFTLPKTIYGRHAVISKLNNAIERYVAEYRPTHVHSNNNNGSNSVNHDKASVSGTTTSSHISSSESVSDGYSHSEGSSQAGGSFHRSTSLRYSGGIGGQESDGSTSIHGGIVANNKHGSTMIVSLYGPGGIGKSTMFTAVQATARKSGQVVVITIYIATVKFDSRNKVPYSGVLRSLSQILQQVLSETEADIRMFYDHLKAHLGSQFCNIALLADFVPELKALLDPNSIKTDDSNDAYQMDNVEAQARFHNLFVEILRAVTHWRMVTLFLDDLHQADDHSIEIIDSLIIAKVRILILVSYRDQEITPKLGEMLEKEASCIEFIKVDALDTDSMVDFLCDTLHRPRDENRQDIVPLAEIIIKKTAGNAFYTAQLLRTLERKKLIFFNWERNEWDFDLEKIQDGTSYSVQANMQLDVSFMVARLKELSHNSQQVLKWASFVGDTFSWSTVKTLMENSDAADDSSVGSDSNILSDTMTFDDEGSVSTDIGSVETVVDTTSAMRSLSIGRQQRRCQRPTHTNSRATSSTTLNDPMNGLQSVLQEGYIMPLGDDEFKWSHDRITQAAGELASPKARSRIHLAIAQHMMKENDTDTFLIADHLLKCRSLLDGMKDKEPYRKVLIEAGNKGRSSGAHRMAFAFYNTAIELADHDTEWEGDDNYNVTLHLYTNAVSLSWVVGQYERTEELLDIIFEHARTPFDRMPAYRVQSKYCFSCQMHDKGREVLHRCLEDLGEDMEKFNSCTDQELKELYDDLERTVMKMGSEQVINMPACEDPLLRGIVSIMEELCALAYWGEQKKELYYCSMRIVQLSLANGMSPGTGGGCEFCGIAYATLYKKYIFAEEIGAIGLALIDRHGTPYEKGRGFMMYAVFNIRWRYHHREALKYFDAGIDIAYSAGDRIFMAFNQVHRLVILFGLNRNLADTLHEAESNYEDIHGWSASIDSNMFAMCIIRLCLALQGRTFIDTPEVFDGEDGFNDEHFLKESCKHSSNPELLVNWYEAFKIIPQTLYGHLDAAIEIGFRGAAEVDGHPCHRHTRILLHYFSLALTMKLRQDDLDPVTRNKYLEQIKVNQDKVYEWAEHSRINYMMYWTLIEAELASMESDIVRACRLYEEAIDQAREGGWHLAVCIAHECAGMFYQKIGLRNVAYNLIKKAIDLYINHGAYGKARHLSNIRADLLAEFEDDNCEAHETGVQTDLPYIGNPAASSTLGPSTYDQQQQHHHGSNEPYMDDTIPPVTTEETLMTLDIVDMASILKSSQVMSSEIKFENLMTSMMNIILENSGAERGALILKNSLNTTGGANGNSKSTKYAVHAYHQQGNKEAITYTPPRKLAESDDLVSSRIINHTIHTGESIFISDVEQDQRFAVGPWFERSGRKSIICMPIIHKNMVVGCLFIEGSVGLFTQRHITVLGLLCQQMGISITTAFLFMSLKQVTNDKIKMIETQEQALKDARRSKEAADKATRLREIFLANMSHEIRTPFSGFYGMISLLAETNLNEEQLDLVKTAKGSCEGLLQIIDDLLNFSKLQAGKVSLDLAPVVVEDMIVDVIEMLIAMAVQNRINVTYTVANDVPPVVLGDANRLRQIIINLLGNAMKFTDKGEISIRCSIDKQAINKNAQQDAVPLLFEVIDTGIGISEEQRKVLFVPFSQVDGSTTRRYGGTGLGLSICLHLVELMSGRIDVKSTPGEGSNFNFTIWVQCLSVESNRHKNEIDNFLKTLRDTRVIVVDQHLSTVGMVRHLLPTVKVDGACTVEHLQQLHRSSHYDAIIIGMFLIQPSEQQVWSSHIKELVDQVGCGMIMHYPSGSQVTGGANHDLQSTLSNLRTGDSHSSHNTISRITIPLRRQKLLQTLVDLTRRSLSTTTGSPFTSLSASTKSSKSAKLITDEERALFSTMHILAAEDNPVAQKLLYKQLTRLGFQVECANNGLEAVEAWLKHPPGYFQMGFFDHHMPRCDGVEATKKIREIEQERQCTVRFPIVALTADVQLSARETCIKAGMDAYITKPMNQQSLAEALHAYCKRS
ncbi:hypothetical protein K492DRAFT_210311 [Lichtheimia hyalospora FSU 10163]|nr:hypothetical protein K492DRAFT_210311 [Lichtheimia hyalospora FSU 10163]